MKSSPRRTLTALISATAVCAVLGTTAAAAQPTAQRLPKAVTAWAAAWNGADPPSARPLEPALSANTYLAVRHSDALGELVLEACQASLPV